MRDFFFDTANIEFIKSTMEKYGSDIKPNWVRGVTTNPNAFSKIDKFPVKNTDKAILYNMALCLRFFAL